MTAIVQSSKITPEHLARRAIVYLRQSSDKQFRENQESRRLQYALADRVRALGCGDEAQGGRGRSRGRAAHTVYDEHQRLQRTVRLY